MTSSTLSSPSAGARAKARASALGLGIAFRAYSFALALFMLLLLLGLFGCGPSTTPPQITLLPVGAAVPEPLHLGLEMPSQVPLEQPIRLRLVLENNGDFPIEVGLASSPDAFDIVVETPEGTVVWRRLDGVVIPAVLRLRTLQPGQAIGFTDTWLQRTNDGRAVPTGTYQVRGELPIAGGTQGWTTEAGTIQIARGF
jgi:hypothetical protein